MAKGREADLTSEDDEEIYEVEDLLDHCRSKKKSKIDYLVKWFGYSDQYNTWESEKNIFSDELIKKYWERQPISRADFLKGRKEKRKAKSTGKQTKQSNNNNSNKKLKVDKTEKTRLATKPPIGLTWEDMTEVIDMFNTKDKQLFGEVRWKNQEKTYMLSNLIRQHNPIPLLKYYESHITFT